jgi:hypothetical protein
VKLGDIGLSDLLAYRVLKTAMLLGLRLPWRGRRWGKP